MSAATHPVTMYTTTWCGYCVRLKKMMQREGIDFAEVNIETTDGAADVVMAANGGSQTVPTLVFGDGSALTNPSIDQVRSQLAELRGRDGTCSGGWRTAGGGRERDRGAAVSATGGLSAARPTSSLGYPGNADAAAGVARLSVAPGEPDVVLARTAHGWSVHALTGTQAVDDLIEGISLADLVAEEFGGAPEPDRSTRRAARGGPTDGHQPAIADDPRDAELGALRRTVAQLEHALSTRVHTERAIGVFAERHGTTARAAFDSLRRNARSQGRTVHELAQELLHSLADSDAVAQFGPVASGHPSGPVAAAGPAAAGGPVRAPGARQQRLSPRGGQPDTPGQG